MAQLLLITASSISDNDNRQINDIVQILDDDHKFTEIEKQIFQIVKVGLDKTYIESLRPEVNTLVRAKSTDWGFEKDLERKEVWKATDGSYKEIVERPMFALCYDKGSIKECYSRIAANTLTTLKAASAEKEL